MHSAKPFNTCQHWQQLHPIFDVSPPWLECLDNHRRKSLEWAVEKGIIHPSKSLVLIGWVQWKAWWDFSVRTDWLRRWTNETALVLSPGKRGMFGHRRGDGLCPANNLLPREKWNKICMLAPSSLNLHVCAFPETQYDFLIWHIAESNALVAQVWRLYGQWF